MGGLPKDVGSEANIFFKEVLAWLKSALSENNQMKAKDAEREAAQILATLEGGMLISNSLEDPSFFETVASKLAG